MTVNISEKRAKWLRKPDVSATDLLSPRDGNIRTVSRRNMYVFLMQARCIRDLAVDTMRDKLGLCPVHIAGFDSRTFNRGTVNRGTIKRGQLIAGQLIAWTHNRWDN